MSSKKFNVNNDLDHNKDSENPFESPSLVSQFTEAEIPVKLRARKASFDQQLWILGFTWVIFSLICFGLAVCMVSFPDSLFDLTGRSIRHSSFGLHLSDAESVGAVTTFGFFGLIFLIGGILAFRKLIAGVWLGLIPCYLLLVGTAFIMIFSISNSLICVVLVIMAAMSRSHKAIGHGVNLRNEGVRV